METSLPDPKPLPDSADSFDDPVFEALYTEHSKAVYYLALRMLSDPTQAEDAAHDVFLKAFRNLKQFRGDSEIRTWLYRITINHCQNIVKSWHHRKMVNNVEDGFLENSSLHTDSPLEVLEGTELGERIQETLHQLPEEYRLLLLLVADQRLTYEQIGQLTNQSGDAVRGKLHRARKAFALQFKQTE